MKIKLICPSDEYETLQKKITDLGFNIVDYDYDYLLIKGDSHDGYLTGKMTNNEKVRIKLSEIYYIESYDGKCFLNIMDHRFEISEKLYQIESYFHQSDLIRINKSQIVSLDKIAKISPQFNSTIKIRLKNNHILFVSRSYLPLFKEKVFSRRKEL